MPNYKEFYEARWFAPGIQARNQTLRLLGQDVPFGTDLLFDAGETLPGLVVGVEICEDLWVPVPPSSGQALAGATLLVNLSASNEVIGKASYRRQLVENQSGRCLAAYLYASCGVHESTTDLVFGGHCLVAENGVLLTESARFQRDETLLCADVDIQRLQNERHQIQQLRRLAIGGERSGSPPPGLHAAALFAKRTREASIARWRPIRSCPPARNNLKSAARRSFIRRSLGWPSGLNMSANRR